MGKQDFEKFLQGQTGSTQKATFDAEAEMAFWRGELSKLYNSVRDWLSEYEDKITLSFDDISIYEKPFGTYTVKSATIYLGNKKAHLKPIGTNIIGTPGRVDLIGPVGTIKLVLADILATGPNILIEEFTSEADRLQKEAKRKEKASRPIDWVWKATTPPPRLKYTTLTQDIFLDCLMSVLDA